MMLPILRWANESVTFFGTGLYGFTYACLNGNARGISKYVSLTAVGAGLFYSIIREKSKKSMNAKNVVLITGCDSGLG